ncbi:hypothetical protein [Chitinivorax sp. B]|uniref:hypothetical protein n=1 Tax=Chitinivorax sp. B TaxID=2502235 RepID=UPI0010F7EC87|nr:hypothetical protein [Chitinivorax sp. B]
MPGLISLLMAVLFMLVAAWLYWPSPEIAFRTDESPVAWLSSAQMWAMAVLSLRLWGNSILPRKLCLWLALAMMGMAFDEQFMLHEHWKYSCHQWISACRYTWMTELPMLLVGSLGLLTGIWLQHSLLTPHLRRLLWASLLIGLMALLLRFTEQPIVLLPYKAALLVIAQALFIATLLGVPSASADTRQVHSA